MRILFRLEAKGCRGPSRPIDLPILIWSIRLCCIRAMGSLIPYLPIACFIELEEYKLTCDDHHGQLEHQVATHPPLFLPKTCPPLSRSTFPLWDRLQCLHGSSCKSLQRSMTATDEIATTNGPKPQMGGHSALSIPLLASRNWSIRMLQRKTSTEPSRLLVGLSSRPGGSMFKRPSEQAVCLLFRAHALELMPVLFKLADLVVRDTPRLAALER